jgi:hypothetical protein
MAKAVLGSVDGLMVPELKMMATEVEQVRLSSCFVLSLHSAAGHCPCDDDGRIKCLFVRLFRLHSMHCHEPFIFGSCANCLNAS